MKSLGNHILVEFHGCSAEILNDVPHIESSMNAAAKEAGATVISSVFHHFSPVGVSGVVVIQESHLAIHTWPEYGYAAVDLFTCGTSVSPWIAYEFLKNEFQAKQGSALEINRGQLDLLENDNIEWGALRDQATSPWDMPKDIPKDRHRVWVTHRNENMALSLRHKGDRLFCESSPYQTVEVFDTIQYGKMLTLDKMVRCSEKTETAYHEMLIHVPMVVNPDVKQALVIGGGDGGSVRELVRYPNLEQVTMVEIDEVVVRASRECLPSLSCALEHPKLDLRIEDGWDYINNSSNEQFDLIVMNTSDPIGSSEGGFRQAFYQGIYRCLCQGGILTGHGKSPHVNPAAFIDWNRCLRRVFTPEDVWCYLAFIPTHPTGMWSFNYCSKGGRHPFKDMDEARSRQISQAFDLQYYNPDIHHAAFCLPTFIQNMLR